MFAQSNYQPGYVVIAPGDTLKGSIDYKEWSKNPNEIFFKSFTNPLIIQQFNAEAIRYVKIDGYAVYESFTVSISMDEVELSSLSEGIDTSKISKTVFLKLLLKGDKVRLYSFKDALKSRFYVLEQTDTTPQELGYKQQRKGSQVITLASYKQQLNSIALKSNALSPKMERLIQGASYSKSDLLTIVSGINQINENKTEQILEKKKKSRFFLSTGLSYNTMIYKGESNITYDKVQYGYNVYKDHVTTHAYSPKLSTGIDWFVNPAIQRVIFRGEISAFLVKSETATVEQYDYPDEEVAYQYHLSAVCISVAPQILYSIYNKENFKFYVGAGVSATFWHFNQNTMDRKPYDPNSSYNETSWEVFQMKDYFMNVVVRSGIIVRKKLDLSVIYFNPAELTNTASGSDLSVKSSSLQLSIGYLFNRSK